MQRARKTNSNGGVYHKTLKRLCVQGENRQKAVNRVCKMFPKAKRETIRNASYYVYGQYGNVSAQHKKECRKLTIEEYFEYKNYLKTGKILL